MKCSHRAEECQDEICIEITLSQLWISKAAVRSFHCHKKLLRSLHPLGKLKVKNLDREESRMRILISILYPCHVGESVMSTKLRLLSPSLLTCAQCLTVVRFSMLDRKCRFGWQNYANHKMLAC